MSPLQACSTTAILAASLFAALPASAAIASDPFSGLDALGGDELGRARGGMMINGIPVNFAVVIRTTIEGAMAQGMPAGLQTTLSVDDYGALAGATTIPIGTAAVPADPKAGAVAMTLPSGTSILHQVVDGQIQALIANMDDGVSLYHRTEVNVELPGFSQISQTWQVSSAAARMGRDAAQLGLGR
ncbi:hypothetical protein [Magnetospirillum sp. UT-4]|uniref:hypothetical protein n=1 Tax=Magnetospirillum sp. UT-4 TaxID=2681467 RepID=UPI0013811EAD|nr:hypothetical protein [Magnetospirillum sp. UT-4]CAA7623920.1 exported hypothetical protein [Magnetospirillum sp. UT-4]